MVEPLPSTVTDGVWTLHYAVAGEPVAVQNIVEKPSVEASPSTLAVAARYVFSPVIFEMLDRTLPGKGGEIQLTDALRSLITQGETLFGVRLSPEEKRYDIGNFGSYFRAFVEFCLADDKYGADLRRHLEELLDADHT